MKKYLITLVYVVLIFLPLESKTMTIGFHFNLGFSSIGDKWSHMPYEKIESIEKWDSGVNGYFIQLFLEGDKVDFGIEFGRNKFYEFTAGWMEPVLDSFYWKTINGEFYSKRILGVVQFNPIRNLVIQSGIGVYTDPPQSYKAKGPFLAVMASSRYHLKLSNSIELPVFLRIDLNAMEATPTSYSAGVGLVVKWNSGL